LFLAVALELGEELGFTVQVSRRTRIRHLSHISHVIRLIFIANLFQGLFMIFIFRISLKLKILRLMTLHDSRNSDCTAFLIFCLHLLLPIVSSEQLRLFVQPLVVWLLGGKSCLRSQNGWLDVVRLRVLGPLKRFLLLVLPYLLIVFFNCFFNTEFNLIACVVSPNVPLDSSRGSSSRRAGEESKVTELVLGEALSIALRSNRGSLVSLQGTFGFVNFVDFQIFVLFWHEDLGRW